MSAPSANMIIVTYRDPPARLGAEHPRTDLSAQGHRIVAGDHGQNHDPVRDLIEDPISMSARLHCRRGARIRAMRAATATTQDTPEPEVV